MTKDNDFMLRALTLAKKGLGFTSPNPAVGAVIVKNGKIIGEGYHHKAGLPHAEVEAIRAIKNKKDLATSTLYVTLEPCCHTGKTPPCTDLILSSGIKHVVVGMRDPFQKVNGKGIQILKKNKVKVKILDTKSTLVKEIRLLNQPFLKWAKTGLPYVVLKVAVSLDGKIATRTGDSKWITNEKSRTDGRLERSLCDAVVVGAGTVAADDPELAPHGRYKNKKLLRVIIDPELSLPLGKKVFRDKNILVAYTDRANKKDVLRFQKAGIEIQSFGKDTVAWKKLFEYLAGKNIQKVFVEGGAGVHGSLHDAALKDKNNIDEFIFYIAPKIVGGKNAVAAIGGEGIEKVAKGLELEQVTTEQVGSDVKIKGLVNWY